MSDAREEYFAVAKRHAEAVKTELDMLDQLEFAFGDWCEAVQNTGRLALECYDKADAVTAQSVEEAGNLAALILDMKAELDRLSALHTRATEGET
jgi:hypothetical protein